MDGEEFRDIELEVENESEEARVPKVFRDPGAPTETEIEQHNVTHLPFRAWCPSCVEGKARDRPHPAGCGRKEFGGGGLRLRVPRGAR